MTLINIYILPTISVLVHNNGDSIIGISGNSIILFSIFFLVANPVFS
jgi:hypothetical protein